MKLTSHTPKPDKDHPIVKFITDIKTTLGATNNNDWYYKNMYDLLLDAGIEMKKAEDFQVRRGMQEQRDINTEDRARSQIQAGEQAQTSAIMGLGSMMMSAGAAGELNEANEGTDPAAKRTAQTNLRQQRRMTKLGIGAQYDPSQTPGQRRQLIRDAGGGFFNTDVGQAVSFVPRMLGKGLGAVGGFFKSIF